MLFYLFEIVGIFRLHNLNVSSNVFYQLANNFLVKHMFFILVKNMFRDVFCTDVLFVAFLLQVSNFEEICAVGLDELLYIKFTAYQIKYLLRKYSNLLLILTYNG